MFAIQLVSAHEVYIKMKSIVRNHSIEYPKVCVNLRLMYDKSTQFGGFIVTKKDDVN